MEAYESIGRAYMAKFDNLPEVIDPSIMQDRRFLGLLEKAIATGKAVTRAQVIKRFGFAPWEEIDFS